MPHVVPLIHTQTSSQHIKLAGLKLIYDVIEHWSIKIQHLPQTTPTHRTLRHRPSTLPMPEPPIQMQMSLSNDELPNESVRIYKFSEFLAVRTIRIPFIL